MTKHIFSAALIIGLTTSVEANDQVLSTLNLNEFLSYNADSNAFSLKPEFNDILNTSEYKSALEDGDWSEVVAKLVVSSEELESGVSDLAAYINDYNLQVANNPYSEDYSSWFNSTRRIQTSQTIDSPNDQRLQSPQIYTEGAVFSQNFINQLNDSETLGRDLLNPNTALDLEALGLAKPETPVDSYVLFDSQNNLTGVITIPAGTELSEDQKAALKAASTWEKKIAKYGGQVYSSVEDIIALTVKKICQSAFLPEEFSVNVSGSGNVFFAEMGIDISAKFKSGTVCVPFL